MCIGPSESLISCWTSESHKLRPVAIAAVLVNDTSAIVAKESSDFKSLSDLDGTRYASYQGRFEMAIVKQMIINSGGKGDVEEVNPPKLDCFDAVMRGDAESTWIFEGWEGLIAKRNGTSLISFPVSLSGVPYGYSPLLMADPASLTDPGDTETIKQFLAITARGYEHATANPLDASQCLLNIASDDPYLRSLGPDFIFESTDYLAKGGHFIDKTSGKWGRMESTRWNAFIQWLLSNKVLSHRDGSLVTEEELNLANMYSNEFLP